MTLNPPVRLRRSILTTPASSEAMMNKAAASDADYVLIDLEDSVAPSRKALARSAACAAITDLDWGRKTVGVRVNAVGSPWILDDLLELVGAAGDKLDVICVSKVTGPDDLRFVSRILDHVEPSARLPIGIDVLVEEAQAVVELHAVVGSSPRIECIAFGPGDYAASLRADIGSGIEGTGHAAFARNLIVVAARGAGAVPIDGPYADFSDAEGFQRESLAARRSGFAGKWVIHPSQIAAANEAFTPTDAEARKARAVCDAYQSALENGTGAVAVDGQMIDAATFRLAEEVLALCRLVDG